MSLHLLKMRPDRAALARWGYRGGLVLRGGDLGYALHAALSGAFGGRAPRPHRLIERSVEAVLYGYTREPADAMIAYARAVADPELMAVLGIEAALSKEMPKTWRRGDRFGFEVRVRPVIRQDREGDRTRSRELDAFQAAAESAAATPDARPADGDGPTRQGIYADWLAARFEGACRLADRPRLIAFHRTRVARRDGNRVLRESEGPDAVLDGLLEVTEPEAFGRLLAEGIGRHRAFGFGMVLLRPAR